MLVMVLVAAGLGLLILGGIGGELGKRSQAQTEAAAPEVKAAQSESKPNAAQDQTRF